MKDLVLGLTGSVSGLRGVRCRRQRTPPMAWWATSIDCSGSAMTWSHCLEKAGQLARHSRLHNPRPHRGPQFDGFCHAAVRAARYLHRYPQHACPLQHRGRSCAYVDTKLILVGPVADCHDGCRRAIRWNGRRQSTIRVLVLDTGRYGLYGPARNTQKLDAGFIVGDGTAYGSAFKSHNLRDFVLEAKVSATGALKDAFSPKASISGSGVQPWSPHQLYRRL